jgi:hypothetical protein
MNSPGWNGTRIAETLPAPGAEARLISCVAAGSGTKSRRMQETPRITFPPISERSKSALSIAALRGSQETPPTPSAAEDSSTALVDANIRVLIAAVTTTGITGAMAHIQAGPPGTSGPVVFPLGESTQDGGVWTTRVMRTDARLAALQAGDWYFNMRSAVFPDGEIRGQIMPLLCVPAIDSSPTTGANL